jgi:predicted small lipoprotein YifL
MADKLPEMENTQARSVCGPTKAAPGTRARLSRRVALGLMLTAMLSACGQKGPLTLPKDAAAKPAGSASSPTAQRP